MLTPKTPKTPMRTSHEFLPASWLPGAHLQTIWGSLTRPRRLVEFRREILETPDGDELVLDHLDGPRSDVRVILLHGLEGSSYSVYVQGLLARLRDLGVPATAINFRSCARNPRRVREMIPNRRPRLYHSGETTDFDHVIRTLAAREPRVTFGAIGASLGGNVLLKWLGEHPGQPLVSAAATLSVPYDLGAGGLQLERGLGRLYVNRFLRTLRRKAIEVALRFDLPKERIDVDAALRARTFRQFDDAATAPLHGMRDADDYYATCSSIHFVGRVTAPTLCISAEDDPFLPASVLERVREAKSDAVTLLTPSFGGHTGFVGGTPWSCRFWAEETLVTWLLARLEEEREPERRTAS